MINRKKNNTINIYFYCKYFYKIKNIVKRIKKKEKERVKEFYSKC